MLRGLFGSNDSNSPTPPKNQISVVCPECGAAQFEPRLVVSTFCKKCGVHLTIRKKKVTASAVTRSGVGFADPWADSAPAAPPEPVQQADDPAKDAPPLPDVDLEETSSAPEVDIQGDESSPDEAPEPAPDSNDDEEVGFGSFLKKQAEPKPTRSPNLQRRTPTRKPSSNSPPPTPTPPPASQSTLQKMKDMGMYRNQYFKDADCFECRHKFKVGRSSRSTQCPQCGAYISMEDVEINMPSSQAIKTRGDVTIRKRGHVTTSEIQCKDLRCQGIVEANVFCTADAVFRTEGTIIGEIHCRRLIIEKGADVTFRNTAFADEVEVNARVTGTLSAKGPVIITHHGVVSGDVTARSVSIEPGGELNGAMNIVHSAAPTPGS